MENRNFIPADTLLALLQKKLQPYNIPYNAMVDALYTALQELANHLIIGDTVELPDGTTLQAIWRPTVKYEATPATVEWNRYPSGTHYYEDATWHMLVWKAIGGYLYTVKHKPTNKYTIHSVAASEDAACKACMAAIE